jgi:hypothetical protein
MAPYFAQKASLVTLGMGPPSNAWPAQMSLPRASVRSDVASVLVVVSPDRPLPTETDVSNDSPPTPVPPVLFPELACGDKSLGSAGCSFYSVEPPNLTSSRGRCHVMFVVNPGNKAAVLTLTNGGTTYTMARVARTPRSTGTGLRYEAFDPAAGLSPGQVVIVFLAGKKPDPEIGPDGHPGFGCPDGVESALPDGGSPGLPLPTAVGRVHSNRGTAFHLTADRPVVAYDMNPFSMALSYTPSASLLIPEGVCSSRKGRTGWWAPEFRRGWGARWWSPINRC